MFARYFPVLCWVPCNLVYPRVHRVHGPSRRLCVRYRACCVYSLGLMYDLVTELVLLSADGRFHSPSRVDY